MELMEAGAVVVVFTLEQPGSSEHGGAVTLLRAKTAAGL